MSIEKMPVNLSQLIADLKGLLLPRSLEQSTGLEFILNKDLPKAFQATRSA